LIDWCLTQTLEIFQLYRGVTEEEADLVLSTVEIFVLISTLNIIVLSLPISFNGIW